MLRLLRIVANACVMSYLPL